MRLLVRGGLPASYEHDFRDYAGASLKRRVLQAHASAWAADTISALQERVLHDPAQFAQLLQFLTVPVSEMFRDPAYFLALRRHVVPVLRTYPSLKVWVAGCSTGEEVYSLAILLQEEGLLERTHPLRDRHQPRLAGEGAAGHLPAGAACSLYTAQLPERRRPAQLLATTTRRPTAARCSTARCAQSVTFADHSLATDAVFSETHLVSLPQRADLLQPRACRTARWACSTSRSCQRGFLGLGSKETLDFSAYADRFEPVSRRRSRVPQGGSDGMKRELRARASASPHRGGGDRRLGRRHRCAAARCSTACQPPITLPSSSCCTCPRTTRAGWSRCSPAALRAAGARGAADKQAVAPGTIYFAPPGYHLLVERDRSFSLSCDPPVLFSRPSIDVLFDSCAEAYGAGLAGHRADRRQRGRRPRARRASRPAAA